MQREESGVCGQVKIAAATHRMRLREGEGFSYSPAQMDRYELLHLTEQKIANQDNKQRWPSLL